MERRRSRREGALMDGMEKRSPWLVERFLYANLAVQHNLA